MKKNSMLPVLLSTIVFLTAACKKNEQEPENTISFQASYTITDPGLYPEGVDYDTKNERFVFGSFYKGSVLAMNTKGEVSTIIHSNKLVSVTGIYTDEIRNRLIVANADLGISEKSGIGGTSAGSIAYVGIYNLTTGNLIREINLKILTNNASAFPNDIAVDTEGNIYVTDSFSPVIYKIDGAYNANIFVTDPLFQPAPGSFGLNGIVFHPDGFLLVAKSDNSKLFKIQLITPTIITEVNGVNVSSPDGLEWTKDGKLIVVDNGFGDGKTYSFSSSNSWVSTSKVSETTIGVENFPTSATLASNGEIYVLSSKLGKLVSGDKSQSSFALQKL